MPSSTQIDALFDSLDSDGSGELDVAELKELLTRHKETAQQESTRRRGEPRSG
jgi:Ca2+-binding EF-hand superfamily protein